MSEPLSLFWMYDHEEYVIRYPQQSYRWSGFTKDSEDCCSFIVLEEKCLTLSIGRRCQHPKTGQSKSYSSQPQKVVKNYGPVFQSALILNEQLDKPLGIKLTKRGTSGKPQRWKLDDIALGDKFPMGDQGSLKLLEILSESTVLVKWLPRNPFKVAFKSLMNRVMSEEGNMHHTEKTADVKEEALTALPIRILVVA
jgi:hypothetical protein